MSKKFIGSIGANCAFLRTEVGWAFAIFMRLIL